MDFRTAWYCGKEKANMARRPDFSKEVLNRQELRELAKRLKAMGVTEIRDFYAATLYGCRLGEEGTIPKARYIQELVTAWKEMRSWNKKR
jgi:hypothetical protein